MDEKLKEIGLSTRKTDDEDMIRLRANLLGLDYFAEDEARFKELAKLYNEDYSKMDKEIRDEFAECFNDRCNISFCSRAAL